MSQFYKVTDASPLGEPWTPPQDGATAIQTYWCHVEGEEWPVSIGKQVPNVVNVGESLYGDLIKTVSKKGTNYWKFKSQKLPEGVTPPPTAPSLPNMGDPAQVQPGGIETVDMKAIMRELEEINTKLDKLIFDGVVNSPVEPDEDRPTMDDLNKIPF